MDPPVRRVEKIDIEQGKKLKRRPKMTWMEMVKKDMLKEINLSRKTLIEGKIKLLLWIMIDWQHEGLALYSYIALFQTMNFPRSTKNEKLPL